MKINLSNNLSLEAKDYASQGNAILGIKESGKSYTATKIAEQLLDANIPFIAFDPIGIWRYLKVGRDGFPGYPVVVAGGEHGDLNLTGDTAEKIVNAAMNENIPLIIDLYSMDLEKADWRRIVQKSVRLLLYNNKNKGLRHIFIEEASEFIPQRIQPQYGSVYAEIEKLARMGRNASLGYTIINQRAEEVNKAILEICAMTILHKQTGRNSLKAIREWFKIVQLDDCDSILKSLPQLKSGDCWIVGSEGHPAPELIHVLAKKTIHPNPKQSELDIKGIPIDVTKFVTRLNKQLTLLKAKQPVTIDLPGGEKLKIPSVKDDNLELIKTQVSSMEARVSELENQLVAEKNKNSQLRKIIDNIKEYFKPQHELLSKLFGELEDISTPYLDEHIRAYLNNFTGKEKEIFEDLIKYGRGTKAQISMRVGISPNTINGAFDKAMVKIKKLGLIEKSGSEFIFKT